VAIVDTPDEEKGEAIGEALGLGCAAGLRLLCALVGLFAD
jgi:hypothetical protein